MNCAQCGNSFPPTMIQPLFANGEYRDMCPICALAIVNTTAGLPEGTPFRGPKAKALYDAAVAHLEKKAK